MFLRHKLSWNLKVELVARYRVNRSLISKWLKNKIEISQAAVGEHKNMLRIRKSQKYNDLFKELRDVFMAARENGRPVDYNWLWSKGRNIYKKQQGQDAILRKHVIVTFIKRNHLKLRRAQRNKKLSKEHYRNSLKQWHATMRERLIRTGKRDNYDSKFGRYTTMQRFNVDQSPLPFAIDTKKTYERIEPRNPENRYKKVWIQQPGSGLEKRQCTLQVCFRPNGEQPRIAIIFRGQGKRITEAEKDSWHKDVDVYFQKCAWADTNFCVEWVERTLKPLY